MCRQPFGILSDPRSYRIGLHAPSMAPFKGSPKGSCRILEGRSGGQPRRRRAAMLGAARWANSCAGVRTNKRASPQLAPSSLSLSLSRSLSLSLSLSLCLSVSLWFLGFRVLWEYRRTRDANTGSLNLQVSSAIYRIYIEDAPRSPSHYRFLRFLGTLIKTFE